LKKNPVAALHTIEQLNKNYEGACVQIRRLHYQTRSLRGWPGFSFVDAAKRERPLPLPVTFRIYARRDRFYDRGFAGNGYAAVKRIQRRGLIEVNGSIMTICDPRGLEAMTDEKSNGGELGD
jgi:hypothetical protein